MKKLYSLLFALLLAVGVLAGCGGSAEEPKENNAEKETQPAQEEKADFPVTIKDALDNEVVIESKPEKIVSLIPSNTEIAFGLGLGEEVVGVSDYDNYPAEASEKEKIGGMEFNVEKIISLSPNLVLAHASSAQSAEAGLQQLRDAGINVLIVNDAANFDEVFNSINMIGTATGKKVEAEALVESMKAKLEEIKEKAKAIKDEERKKVFVEVSPAPEIYAVGANTFMDEMLQMIHADNVVTEENWPKMDPEAVIERNPDVIITTHGYYTEDPVGNVLARDGWQDINAVKNNQVVDVDSDTVTRSGPRLVEGVELLAKAIYPETFK
ncbi:ABC transporter substrate-binding protein [Bacillus sp. DTU_2020_1000418_1_SI_GHA_SEK_038]|uniref:ABC transporter substrate-binding protein n=1 Tax=Bacillus sp. DTU_2020_1000418_1_SI_GHA_SEK_038 TaxID=3077585 RepID=UPI0028ED73EA|nr:ABC transporter substrate-binding protein [Bacillus sp. DTU_2020_1000418_1_SI_GHA_SEK_038]WNS75908.1 ABC transporter substrate-binding protein [Bacillus sp. DTU_2020_1000418_1_SI_GHA_SEK_038]